MDENRVAVREVHAEVGGVLFLDLREACLHLGDCHAAHLVSHLLVGEGGGVPADGARVLDDAALHATVKEIGRDIYLTGAQPHAATPLAVEGALAVEPASLINLQGSTYSLRTSPEGLASRMAPGRVRLATVAVRTREVGGDARVLLALHVVQNSCTAGHDSVPKLTRHVDVVGLPRSLQLVDVVLGGRRFGGALIHGVGELHRAATHVDGSHSLADVAAEMPKEVVEGQPGKGALVGTVKNCDRLVVAFERVLSLQVLAHSLQDPVCLAVWQQAEAGSGPHLHSGDRVEFQRHGGDCLVQQRLQRRS
mmetsp:Transcript_35789/g.101286  ORF Transcript_35789/g.101286 Transcript_35789/m.101286 type:complete len:308 (-) Transcript_35789:417-1340(-)